jgi:hypothetical protein
MATPLRPYLTVQAKYDRAIRAALQRAALDTAKRIRTLDTTPGVGAQVRAAQLRVTLRAINDELAATYRGTITPTIVRGQREAAEAAQKASDAIDRVLFRAVGEQAADVLLESFQATARRGISTDAARRRRELSSRVIHNLRDVVEEVEKTIRSGIISGLSPRELARDVFKFISPTTPGGASYAAMRLARTEINNAFHEQQIRAANKPWVEGVKWNLSGSHPRPDQCNDYASQSDGLGRGVFKTGDVPSKPHPQCLCYLTYETLSPSAFLDALSTGKIAV